MSIPNIKPDETNLNEIVDLLAERAVSDAMQGENFRIASGTSADEIERKLNAMMIELKTN